MRRRRSVTGEPLEAEIQVRVAHIYAAVGCRVYWLSQSRATRQTPGPSDLYLVHPTAGCWWHEVKTPAGLKEALAKRDKPKRTHLAQAEFRELHERIPSTCPRRPVVVLGGTDAAWTQLEAVGLVPPRFMTHATTVRSAP